MDRNVIVKCLPILLAMGCGQGMDPVRESQTPAPEQTEATTVETGEFDTDDPTILKRPFTAEEIRNEWVEGLVVTFRRWTPESEITERWTVVAVDDQGVRIENATLDADGAVIGAPTVQPATWVQLRDHASFSADSASREWVSRATPIGDLEGWLYIVRDNEAGTVSKFFFAASLPGAPVQMRILEKNQPVFALEQLARSHPDKP